MWSSTFPWGTSSDLSRRALQAKPNPAHDVIAKMSVPSYLKQVAPDAESFHLITQNIDRLSVTALNVLVESLPPESAAISDSSRKSAVFQNSILEMHGRIYDVKCTVCDYCAEDRTHPLCPALGAAGASLKTTTMQVRKRSIFPRNSFRAALPVAHWHALVSCGLERRHTTSTRSTVSSTRQICASLSARPLRYVCCALCFSR